MVKIELTHKNPKKVNPIKPDWWLKTLAGFLFGFVIALSVSGIFTWLSPGGLEADSKVQFNMWLIPFIWMPILSLVYLFQTGRRAILYLASLSMLTYILLIVVKQVMAG